MGRRKVDITGQKFGRLTVIKAVGKRNGHMRWLCLCTCGTKKSVRLDCLRGKIIVSCGCYRIECKTTHGMRHTATYRVWQGMKKRTLCKTSKDYINYGGRGITLCKRWLKFENFLKDMGIKPPGKSLDRINNNKGYCKSNCRWATPTQQNNNRRDNNLIKYKGISLTLPAWERKLGFKKGLLSTRYYQLKWPIEKILTTPVNN